MEALSIFYLCPPAHPISNDYYTYKNDWIDALERQYKELGCSVKVLTVDSWLKGELLENLLIVKDPLKIAYLLALLESVRTNDKLPRLPRVILLFDNRCYSDHQDSIQRRVDNKLVLTRKVVEETLKVDSLDKLASLLLSIHDCVEG